MEEYEDLFEARPSAVKGLTIRQLAKPPNPMSLHYPLTPHAKPKKSATFDPAYLNDITIGEFQVVTEAFLDAATARGLRVVALSDKRTVRDVQPVIDLDPEKYAMNLRIADLGAKPPPMKRTTGGCWPTFPARQANLRIRPFTPRCL